MYNAASGWLMVSLNSDALLVSLVQVATSLPMFLFAPRRRRTGRHFRQAPLPDRGRGSHDVAVGVVRRTVQFGASHPAHYCCSCF